MNRVVVTGLGIVSCIGNNKTEVLEAPVDEEVSETKEVETNAGLNKALDVYRKLIEKKPENRIEMFFSYSEENLKKRNIKINGYGKWSNYDFKKI